MGLAVLANVLADALDALSFDAARERGAGIDGAAGEIVRTGPAYGIKLFKCEAEGVKAGVTGRAGGIGAVLFQHLAEWQLRFGFVGGEFWN